MRRLTVIFITLCFSINFNICIAEEVKNIIPVTTLVNFKDISRVNINPVGDVIAVAGQPNSRLQLKLVTSDSKTETIVYQAKKGEKISLVRLDWIDNTRFYFTLYKKYRVAGKYISWVGEISDSNSLTFKVSKLSAQGHVIDTLPLEDNKLIYSAKTGRYNRKITVFETNVESLLKDNFKGQTKFRNKLSDGYNYRTDHHGDIRFSSTYDEDTFIVSHWFLDDDNEWQKFYDYDHTENKFWPVGYIEKNTLAVLSNVTSDQVALFEFDLITKSIGKLIYQHKKNDLTSVHYDKNSGNLKSVSYLDNGEHKTEYFKETDEKTREKIESAFPNKVIDVVSESADGNNKILKVYSAEHSGHYFILNTTENKAEYLGASSKFFERFSFGEMITLSVKSKQGHDIEAYLTKPEPSVDNGTLLVMPHGGPIGIRNSKYFNTSNQYFATRGFSILQVNFRGSEGFGKAYKDSGRGQFGRIIEEDISTVVAAVSKQKTFKHVCSIGGSYGGYSSVMLAMQNPDLYKCVIARFGVFDLPLIFNDRNTKLDEKTIERWEKVVGKNDENQKTVSPVFFAHQLKAPILITAGVKDTQASFEHSNRLKLVLEAEGADVEHIYYPNSGHGHRNYRSVRHELAYIDDFIRRKLNLGLPVGKNSKHIKRTELNLIANGFKDNKVVGNQKEKSRIYSQRAKNTQ